MMKMQVTMSQISSVLYFGPNGNTYLFGYSNGWKWVLDMNE